MKWWRAGERDAYSNRFDRGDIKGSGAIALDTDAKQKPQHEEEGRMTMMMVQRPPDRLRLNRFKRRSATLSTRGRCAWPADEGMIDGCADFRPHGAIIDRFSIDIISIVCFLDGNASEWGGLPAGFGPPPHSLNRPPAGATSDESGP